MNLRILSTAALTGMLAATGCGGGAGSGAIAPAVGVAPSIGGGVGATSAKHSLSISFRMPKRATATASSARSPKYVSPGTTGASIYLSVVNTIAAGDLVGTIPANTFPAGTAIATNWSPTSLSGTLPVSGTAITALTGSSTATATYSIALEGTSYSVATITIPGVTGSSTIATVPNDQFVRVGAVLTDSTGFVLSEAQSPSTSAGSAFKVANTGPTIVPLTLLPVPASIYLIGSDGVNGDLGSPVTLAQAQATEATPGTPPTNVAAGTYELTAYVADHAGFVIPGQDAVTGSNIVAGWVLADLGLAFDNGATYQLTTDDTTDLTIVSTLLPGTGGAVGGTGTGLIATTAGLTQNLDPLPTAAQATLAAAGPQGGPGYLVANVTLPGGTVGGGNYSAGIPLNIAIANNATPAQTTPASVFASLTETKTGLALGPQSAFKVSGFTYTSTNYPVSGALAGAGGTTGIVSVPLTPSVVPIIQ